MSIRAVAASSVLALAALVACTDDGDAGATSSELPPPTSVPAPDPSSPFAVAAPPPGFDLVSAGVGASAPDWGEDSFGTTQPVTVLAPGGDVTDPGIVVVSVTGYIGYQGGLDQAAGASNDDDLRSVEVGGRPARFLPAGDRDQNAATEWAVLTVARGEEEDDLAVQVTARDATLDELAAVEARVAFAGREQGPVVEDPPDGLEVVGSGGTDAVLATYASGSRDAGYVPGSERDHVAVWRSGAVGLAVVTLPGASLDPAGLPGLMAGASDDIEVSEVDVDGRPGIAVAGSTRFAPDALSARWVAVTTDWGDTLFVLAGIDGDGFGGAPDAALLPSVEDLVAVAASVSPADDATWDAFVATVTG